MSNTNPSHAAPAAMGVFAPSTLLRRALLADAVITGASGVLQSLLSGFMEELLRVPASFLLYSGLFFLPYAAFVAYLGTRARLTAPPVWAVIACNTLWAVDCALILVLGWIKPNPLGYAFVIMQVVVVGLFAELQYFGLRRSRN